MNIEIIDDDKLEKMEVTIVPALRRMPTEVLCKTDKGLDILQHFANEYDMLKMRGLLLSLRPALTLEEMADSTNVNITLSYWIQDINAGENMAVTNLTLQSTTSLENMKNDFNNVIRFMFTLLIEHEMQECLPTIYGEPSHTTPNV